MPPVPFQPADPAALQRDLLDTSLSFDEIARKHHTTLNQLALWLTSEQGTNALTPAADSLSLRIRLIASSHIPQALDLIKHIVESYAIDNGLQPSKPDIAAWLKGQPQTPQPKPQLSPEETWRAREGARRAAALLLRFTRFSLSLTPPSRRRITDPPPRSHPPGPRADSTSLPAALYLSHLAGAPAPAAGDPTSAITAIPSSSNSPFTSSPSTAAGPTAMPAAPAVADAPADAHAAYLNQLAAAARQARIVLARQDPNPPMAPFASGDEVVASTALNQILDGRPTHQPRRKPASNSPASLLALSGQPRAP